MTASQWFSVDVSQWVVVAIVPNGQWFLLLCIFQLWTFCANTDKSDKFKTQKTNFTNVGERAEYCLLLSERF